MTYDDKGKENIVVAVAIGDSEDYDIFFIEDLFNTADTYHFVDSTSLQDITSSVSDKTFFDALTLSPTHPISYPTLIDNDVVVALLLIFPKHKGVEIVEEKISNTDI